MPWTSTGAFAQPLAGLSLGAVDHEDKGKGENKTNYASYAAVNFLTWQGLGDIVNRWRVKTLNLEAVPATDGPHLIESLKYPAHQLIDITGFFFRDPPDYTPAADLKQFLSSGPPPVYIGFGSIVVGDPDGLLTMALAAVRAVGVRAIISRGRSKLAGEKSADILFVGDCPHEWLFQHVGAVVHHAGAGTTACGLRYGRPTVIIPFFGDQPFWGEIAHRAGVGPPPLPYESLTSQRLARAIRICLSPKVQEAAAALSCKMAAENGVAAAVDAFYRHLPRDRMTCDFYPDETAVWAYGRGKKEIKICRGVATVLHKHGKNLKGLRLLKTGAITTENRRWDPVTAVSAASLATLVGVANASIDVIRQPVKEYRKQHVRLPETTTGHPRPDSTDVAVPDGTAVLPLSHATLKDAIEGTVTTDSSNSVEKQRSTDHSTASAVIRASIYSMGKVTVRSVRGLLIDIPLAGTEGMRAVPELWGEQVQPHVHIGDFRSGVFAAGHSCVSGVSGAGKGIFLRTFEGKKEQGAIGAMKGLGQGAVGFVTKTIAAVGGLAVYTAQGVSKDIRAKVMYETQDRIIQARWREGEWLLESGTWDKGEHLGRL